MYLRVFSAKNTARSKMCATRAADAAGRAQRELENARDNAAHFCNHSTTPAVYAVYYAVYFVCVLYAHDIFSSHLSYIV